MFTCNCEHTNHFSEDIMGSPITQRFHDYLAQTEGPATLKAWVGEVCGLCANTCLADY